MLSIPPSLLSVLSVFSLPSLSRRCAHLLVLLLVSIAIFVPVSVAAAPGVIAAEAVEQPFAIAVEGLGTARANEAIEIRAQLSEIVRRIRFEEGQHVVAGTILVELDDRKAKAAVSAARAALVESEGRHRRALELFQTNAVSESDLEQRVARRDADRAVLAAAEARLADATLRAPFDGQLGLRRISPGSLVDPTTVITTLDDTDPIKLDFTVPETSLRLLEPGLPVSALSAAWPGVEFVGQVDSIDTRVDPVSRTVRVRARIPNPESRLRAGMFLSVRVVRDDVQALMIPEHAILPEQSRQFTYVIGEGDRLEKREIRTGRRRPGEIEVLEGLVAGERVVVEGTLKARPGDVVEVLNAASFANTADSTESTQSTELLPAVGANRP